MTTRLLQIWTYIFLVITLLLFSSCGQSEQHVASVTHGTLGGPKGELLRFAVQMSSIPSNSKHEPDFVILAGSSPFSVSITKDSRIKNVNGILIPRPSHERTVILLDPKGHIHLHELTVDQWSVLIEGLLDKGHLPDQQFAYWIEKIRRSSSRDTGEEKGSDTGGGKGVGGAL